MSNSVRGHRHRTAFGDNQLIIRPSAAPSAATGRLPCGCGIVSIIGTLLLGLTLRPDHRTINALDAGLAREGHRHLELPAQNLDHLRDTLGPGDSESVDVRSSDHDGRGAECECL